MIMTMDALNAIRRLLAELPPVRRVLVFAGVAPVGPGTFSGRTARPTLLLGVEGCANYQIAYHGQVREVALRSGDMLALNTGTSLAVRPRLPYRTLLLGMGDDHLHGHVAQHQSTPVDRSDVWPRLAHPVRFLHVQPPPTALRHAVAGLCALQEDNDHESVRALLARAVLTLLADELARPPMAPGRAAGQRRFSAAKAYVDERFATDLDRNEVARAVGVDPAHVSRLFRRHAACSFNAYLWRRRIELAQELLVDPTTGIAAVARACGCADANYFARRFRAELGRSPSTWTT